MEGEWNIVWQSFPTHSHTPKFFYQVDSKSYTVRADYKDARCSKVVPNSVDRDILSGKNTHEKQAGVMASKSKSPSSSHNDHKGKVEAVTHPSLPSHIFQQHEDSHPVLVLSPKRRAFNNLNLQEKLLPYGVEDTLGIYEPDGEGTMPTKQLQQLEKPQATLSHHEAKHPLAPTQTDPSGHDSRHHSLPTQSLSCNLLSSDKEYVPTT